MQGKTFCERYWPWGTKKDGYLKQCRKGILDGSTPQQERIFEPGFE